MWRAERRPRDPARIASYQFALFGAPSPHWGLDLCYALARLRGEAMMLANFVSMCGCCSMTSSIAALFRSLTQGVYVIGVAHGEERNACTAAWVMQVSFDPLLLALSINPNHSSYRLLKESGAFSVNVLKQDQLDLAARFGDPAREDRLAEGEWTFARLGLPVLREALAWFACEVQNECPAGDHRLVVGKVIDGELVDAQGQPLTYRDTGDMDGGAALFPDRLGK
jgi:flavin reductase (DIM6/NTAB) family NADH-FMN oxidoreductase RutF